MTCTATARFAVAAGETVELRLAAQDSFSAGAVAGSDRSGSPGVAYTAEGRRSWAAVHTGYDGRFPAEVRRSSIILHGLTYGPSGAVVAAATTSLPETLGGSDNSRRRSPASG